MSRDLLGRVRMRGRWEMWGLSGGVCGVVKRGEKSFSMAWIHVPSVDSLVAL